MNILILFKPKWTFILPLKAVTLIFSPSPDLKVMIIIVIMIKTNLILGNHLASGLMPPPVTFLATFAAVTGLK